jgi:hypothetical protein
MCRRVRTVTPAVDHSRATVEKLRYDRKSAAFALSISVRAVDYRLASGELESRRDGNRRYITASSLRRYASRDHFDGLIEIKQKRKVA